MLTVPKSASPDFSINIKIDKTILGGLKIKNKNIIMDASLKNQLNKLKNQLA